MLWIIRIVSWVVSHRGTREAWSETLVLASACRGMRISPTAQIPASDLIAVFGRDPVRRTCTRSSLWTVTNGVIPGRPGPPRSVDEPCDDGTSTSQLSGCACAVGSNEERESRLAPGRPRFRAARASLALVVLKSAVSDGQIKSAGTATATSVGGPVAIARGSIHTSVRRASLVLDDRAENPSRRG